MKTKEELNALKEEVETVSKKLNQLTDEELGQVTGGGNEPTSKPDCYEFSTSKTKKKPTKSTKSACLNCCFFLSCKNS